MLLRSWLFVPADSERKLDKAMSVGADAVILDLEDSVAPQAKATARALARGWLTDHRRQPRLTKPVARWVRINGLNSGSWRDDLAAIMPGAPDGIILPKAAGAEAVRQLSAELYALEQRYQIAQNSTKVIAMGADNPTSALAIPGFNDSSLTRLAGLTWGAEELGAMLGAARKRNRLGEWTGAFAFARTQILLTAHARGIIALDAFYRQFEDIETLTTIAKAACADGFTGMLAIHPAQIPIINAAFTPTESDLAEARAIVQAFAAQPGAAVLQIDRRMIEEPHLRKARRLLGMEISSPAYSAVAGAASAGSGALGAGAATAAAFGLAAA